MPSTSTPVRRGSYFQRRRTGRTAQVIGFTTKPDGIRRARLVDSAGRETRVAVSQILKTYQPHSS